MFDSLEFTSGQDLRVRVWVKDLNGGEVTATDSAVVYNLWAGMCHPDSARKGSTLPHAAIKQLLEANNYVVDHMHAFGNLPGTQWTGNDAHNRIRFATALYVDSHQGSNEQPLSTDDIYFSDAVESGEGESSTVDSIDVFPYSPNNRYALDTVIEGVSYVIPPFQLGRPTTWFAYMDHCWSAPPGRFDWAIALLWPYYNYYGGFMENQVVLGWNERSGYPSSIGIAEQLFRCLLGDLSNGYEDTVDLQTALADIGNPTSNFAEHVILGDPFARIRGVYYPVLGPNNRCAIWDADGDGLHDWIRPIGVED